MKSVEFNGTDMSSTEAEEILGRLLMPKICAANGGYIFKYTYSEVKKQHFFIISPGFIDGERTYHYNLAFSFNPGFELVGGISGSGEFNAVFKEPAMNSEKAETYAALYMKLCSLFPKESLLNMQFDFITRKILDTYLGIRIDSPTGLLTSE